MFAHLSLNLAFAGMDRARSTADANVSYDSDMLPSYGILTREHVLQMRDWNHQDHVMPEVACGLLSKLSGTTHSFIRSRLAQPCRRS